MDMDVNGKIDRIVKKKQHPLTKRYAGGKYGIDLLPEMF
jgi:hypothetical protein